jgi:hypothetical protein
MSLLPTATMWIPPSLSHPRIVLTLPRALAIITACYAGVIWGAHVLFRFLAHVRGDAESPTPTLVFASIAALAWLVSCGLVWLDRGRIR